MRKHLRLVLLGLVFVACGALGTAVYQIAATLRADHVLLHQLLQIEIQRQRAAMPAKGTDAPAPR